MSSVTERIDIVCPRCGEEYTLWYRPALATFTPSTCPHCAYDLKKDPSIHKEGVWTFALDDGDRAER